MPVSPQYRRFQQRYYHEYSERDAGFTHLWHAQRLAEARLRSTKGIADAPDVDFRHPERMDAVQRRTNGVSARHVCRTAAEEQRIVRDNALLHSYLVAASDPAERVRRGVNNFPTPEELRLWDRRDQHLLARRRDRMAKQSTVRSLNAEVFRRLCSTEPSVPSARSLAAWYAVQQRRAASLRRFRRAEAFSGETVLRKECGLRPLGQQSDVRESLVWQQHRPPTAQEALHTGPLLPSLREAARVYTAGSKAGKRPKWKSISALDETLMHYASDMALVYAGVNYKVRRNEESNVTQLWRNGIERAEATRKHEHESSHVMPSTYKRTQGAAGSLRHYNSLNSGEVWGTGQVAEKIQNRLQGSAANPGSHNSLNSGEVWGTGQVAEKIPNRLQGSAANPGSHNSLNSGDVRGTGQVAEKIQNRLQGSAANPGSHNSLNSGEVWGTGQVAEKIPNRLQGSAANPGSHNSLNSGEVRGTGQVAEKARSKQSAFLARLPLKGARESATGQVADAAAMESPGAAGAQHAENKETRAWPAPVAPPNECVADILLPTPRRTHASLDVRAKDGEGKTKNKESDAGIEERKTIEKEEKPAAGGLSLTVWVQKQRSSNTQLALF